MANLRRRSSSNLADVYNDEVVLLPMAPVPLKAEDEKNVFERLRSNGPVEVN